jgi:hypothetical protein
LALSEANWEKQYDGFGRIQFKEGVLLEPQPAKQADVTHAALVLSRTDIDLSKTAVRIKYQNQRFLRSPAANPWEVFWVFFDYKVQPDHHKEANYFILKPNGIELGKAWKSIDQEFLATANEPRVNLMETVDLVLAQDQKRNLQVDINGKNVMLFQNTKKRSLYKHSGRLGLYTEDARVVIQSVELCSLPPGV